MNMMFIMLRQETALLTYFRILQGLVLFARRCHSPQSATTVQNWMLFIDQRAAYHEAWFSWLRPIGGELPFSI